MKLHRLQGGRGFSLTRRLSKCRLFLLRRKRRFPTSARNCEFSPTTIPLLKLLVRHFIMDMAKALATIILPKDLNWRYCAVKIPDWEPRAEVPNLHRSAAATTKNRSVNHSPIIIAHQRLYSTSLDPSILRYASS